MQAILITAYKNFVHLRDLVKFFNDEHEFSIYIHIDRKSEVSPEELIQLREVRSVKLVSQQYKINWGGINHLQAILYLASEALKEKENRYFHLITGHDFPIKSAEEFVQFFTSNGDRDFVEYFTLPYDSWPEGGMDRLSRFNMYDWIDGRRGFGEKLIKRFSKLQRAIGFKRSFRKDFPILYGGSTYWSLSLKSLSYVFGYMNNNPWYLKRFHYSFCSEEIFFQTILLNSPLRDRIVNDNMRFIVWKERNGNFPANLDITDFEDISKSNALFARKFEFPVSQSLLEQVQNNFLLK